MAGLGGRGARCTPGGAARRPRPAPKTLPAFFRALGNSLTSFFTGSTSRPWGVAGADMGAAGLGGGGGQHALTACGRRREAARPARPHGEHQRRVPKAEARVWALDRGQAGRRAGGPQTRPARCPGPPRPSGGGRRPGPEGVASAGPQLTLA